MQNIVKFEEKEFELLNIDGVPMMTCRQIDDALKMATRNGTSTLYTRHSDEFTPEMTRLIKQGRTRVRVFNREGAWLIGMFARTPTAAAFRKWVLTALAAHVDGAERAELSAEDRKAIGGIVKKCAAKAVKDEIAALPAPSFNPQALVEALEKARREEEGHRCIGMAVSPQEKQILQLIRDDYFIAVGKVYRAALDAIEQ